MSRLHRQSYSILFVICYQRLVARGNRREGLWKNTFHFIYPEGFRITIKTNHDSLKWIQNLIKSTGRHAYLCLRFSEFVLNVVHRAGIKHQAVDALSRVPTCGEDNTPIHEDLPLRPVEVIYNLGDTHICVTETTKNDVIPLDSDIAEIFFDTKSTKSEFSREQVNKIVCKTAIIQVGLRGSEFYVDHRGLINRKFIFNEATHRAVLESLRKR